MKLNAYLYSKENKEAEWREEKEFIGNNHFLRAQEKIYLQKIAVMIKNWFTRLMLFKRSKKEKWKMKREVKELKIIMFNNSSVMTIFNVLQNEFI